MQRVLMDTQFEREYHGTIGKILTARVALSLACNLLSSRGASKIIFRRLSWICQADIMTFKSIWVHILMFLSTNKEIRSSRRECAELKLRVGAQLGLRLSSRGSALRNFAPNHLKQFIYTLQVVIGWPIRQQRERETTQWWLCHWFMDAICSFVDFLSWRFTFCLST